MTRYMKNNYYLCTMIDDSLEIYKAFVSFMLPDGVLDYFDLVEFTVDTEEEGVYLSNQSIHLYLEERDNRSEEERQSTRPNGFAEEKKILDFPIRDKRAVLHIKRRRWLDADDKSFKVDLQEHAKQEHPGTRYSKEFAIFLKVADGQRVGNGSLYWVDLYDQS